MAQLSCITWGWKCSNSRPCDWDVPAGQQSLSLTSFSCAEVGAVPGTPAACGAVLSSQQGYRSPAVICMKRMSFVWLSEKEPCGSSVKVAFWAPWERSVCVRVAYPSRNFLVVQLWTAALWVQFPAQPSSYCGARLEVPKFPFCVDFRCCPGASLEEETADKKLSKVQWLHFHIKPLWYLGIACWCFQASVLQVGMCLVALHNWIVKFIFKQ